MREGGKMGILMDIVIILMLVNRYELSGYRIPKSCLQVLVL